MKLLKRVAIWCIKRLHKDVADIKCPRCKLWHSFAGGTFYYRGLSTERFKCGHCGHVSVWDYGLAPVAMLIEGDMK